jgi:NAD(P)-dependent dehydrogenase (short-subunit alcohol dehydrogenase family)
VVEWEVAANRGTIEAFLKPFALPGTQIKQRMNLGSGAPMSDRVVFITGANGGLGTSVTEAFLRTGDKVIGASLHIDPTDFPNANFRALSVDLTHPQQIHDAIEKMIAEYGGLDVLVHVLGGFAGGQPIAKTDDSTWKKMQELNLTSAFYVFRETIPYLRKSKNGRIVAIGSLTAKEPHANLGAYVTFKAALTTLVQTVALENADVGLTANVVLPGTMDTPANRKAMPEADFNKWLNPKQVAELVVWLTDESAGYITGTAIPIEGNR